MTTREFYGFACLAVGAVVVVAQILILLRAQVTATQASSAINAAQQASERGALHLDRVSSLIHSADAAFVQDANLNMIRAELSAASTEVGAAGQAVDAARSDVESWKTTLVSNLSSRVPLATAGIVLIVLGAVINGYIEVAAGNS